MRNTYLKNKRSMPAGDLRMIVISVRAEGDRR